MVTSPDEKVRPAFAQQPNSSGVYVMGPGVKAPEVLYQPLTLYGRGQGCARGRDCPTPSPIIWRDGTVDSFRVLRGVGYGLDESAINTIAKEWRFRPGTFNGEPVNEKWGRFHCCPIKC